MPTLTNTAIKPATKPTTKSAPKPAPKSAPKSAPRPATKAPTRTVAREAHDEGFSETRISGCVSQELRRYFDLLDGQAPANLYDLVMREAESALIRSVLEECGGNQSRAANWLGISRSTLRGKMAKRDAK